MRVSFVTFGCRLNRAEALDREAAAAAAGHEIIPLPSCDDALPPEQIIVRGCSVTARAQHDCEKEIARLRQRFPKAELIVEGCLPAADGPHGASSIEYPGKVPMTTSRAYLKVQDGCAGICSFCIVPHYRGHPVSVPLESALARASAFLAAGYSEIVVTGCNLALYHSAGRNLADLLAALAELKSPNGSAHRIRLGSLEPNVVDAEIIEAMAKHENICRFLHLSLQSAAPRVLAAMRRPYTVEGITSLRDLAVRRLGQRLALGADVICGFPGETEEDFLATAGFVHGTEDSTGAFVNLHVFPYSERPGTPAATMPGAVPVEIRRERARRLEDIGRSQRAAFLRSFIGKKVVVCVERDCRSGWSDEYIRCRLDREFPRRSLVECTATTVVSDNLLVVPTQPNPALSRP